MRPDESSVVVAKPNLSKWTARKLQQAEPLHCEICGLLWGFGNLEEGSSLFCWRCLSKYKEEARQCLAQPDPPPPKEPQFLTVIDMNDGGLWTSRVIPNPRYKGARG
jgi:hypothetical protein